MTDKQEALAALDRATTLVYNIEGSEWQMAYELLEVIINNLRVDADANPEGAA
jgi:hypothetical protein